jgi:putative ABC transport system substrate-binding protein
MNVEVGSKRLELLRELVPSANAFALLVNPATPTRAETVSRELLKSTGALKLQMHVLHASKDEDLDRIFAEAVQLKVGGIVVGPDAFFASRSKQLGGLAARYAVPTIFAYREFAAAGGLVSYGSNNADLFRQVGTYTGRILKGENPANLPVVQATKLEMIINLKSAKALGLNTPLSLLGRADEVIELSAISAIGPSGHSMTVCGPLQILGGMKLAVSEVARQSTSAGSDRSRPRTASAQSSLAT